MEISSVPLSTPAIQSISLSPDLTKKSPKTPPMEFRMRDCSGRITSFAPSASLPRTNLTAFSPILTTKSVTPSQADFTHRPKLPKNPPMGSSESAGESPSAI